MGQHFLRDTSVLKSIIRYISPQKHDLIIEIGAGKGALTFLLAERAGRVVAIEKDKDFIPLLKRKKLTNLEILEEDVLKISFKELIKKEGNFKGGVKVVGNLPYSISSPVLFKVFGEKEQFFRCIFLLQKELAERVCAIPGGKQYSPLSIIFQIYFSTKLCFIVNSRSFSPPPKVESALISLEKRTNPLFSIKEEELFRNFIRGSFRHRRKTLLNNLTMLNFSPSVLKNAFQELRLNTLVRPEQLPISQFVEFFNFLLENSDINSWTL